MKLFSASVLVIIFALSLPIGGAPPACSPNCTTPPGLATAWATSNMSVYAQTITKQITLNHATIAQINSTQPIQALAYNGSVVQLEFESNVSVCLTSNMTNAPSAVFADARPVSNWQYNPSTHIFTVCSDPVTITMFFNYGYLGSQISHAVNQPIAIVMLTSVLILMILVLFSVRGARRHR